MTVTTDGAEPATSRGVVAVVVTYRSAADLTACLRSLVVALEPDDRIVVVDNASPDDSVAVARATGVVDEVISLGRNLGFGTACNRGAARAPGADVLLVNPDATVASGAVRTLRDSLAADPWRAVVGPRVERPDGTLDKACYRSFPDPATAFFRLSRLDRLFPDNPQIAAYNRLHGDPGHAGPIDAGTGAGLLIRREVWDAMGGFDEEFFMYGEDLDLCRRITDAGHVVWYEPAARFVHRKGQSSRQESQRMLLEFHRAMWRYYRKHHSRGKEAVIAPVVLGGISSRWLALAALNAARRRPRVSR